MKVYVDTNVLVAAVLANHPHHLRAETMLQKAHMGEVKGCISTHGVAEFYAVLTRVPLSPPVYPSEAWQILERDLFPCFDVIPLTADEYRETLRACAVTGWIGGRVYDALHLAAARKAGCDQICTFNLGHFRDLAPDLADRIRTP